jgi:hypothetical protein
LHDALDAYDGWAISKGIKKNGTPLTAEEIDELRQLMEEHDVGIDAR